MSAYRISLACWLSITVVTTPTVIAEESHEQCYNLTGATHCFKVPPPGSGDLLQNFDDASKWCADQGYHGLVIDSSEVQSAVERFLEAFELTSDDVWTSARRSTEGEWKWVNGVVYINGSSLPVTDENQTDVSVGYLSYDTGSSSFQLKADSHSRRSRTETNRKYVCQFSGSTCDRYAGTDGYFAGSQSTCYVTFPRRNRRVDEIWLEARNKCLFEGGDLADENAANLALDSGHEYLVGLQRDELTWTQSGNTRPTPVRFTRFRLAGITSFDCVALSYISQWVWSSRKCTDKVLFVCQKVMPRDDDDTSAHCSPATVVYPNTTQKAGATALCEDESTLLGILIGCIVFYVVSVLLVIIITACICRSRAKQSATSRTPTYAYHNDSHNDYIEPGDSHIYNDVRNK